MHRFLHIDGETRELRLVVTDLADGCHERTEFRVLGSVKRKAIDAGWTPPATVRLEPITPSNRETEKVVP